MGKFDSIYKAFIFFLNIFFRLLQNENGTIVPNPDFWAAYMFNEFMIGDVLEIENAINSKGFFYYFFIKFDEL